VAKQDIAYADREFVEVFSVLEAESSSAARRAQADASKKHWCVESKRGRIRQMGIFDSFRRKKTVDADARTTVTAAELADMLWNSIRKLPSDDPSFIDELRSSTELALDDFRNEMTYLLAFVNDFAFHVSLKEAAPNIQEAVRDAHGAHVQSFAKQARCKPMPQGEWVRGLYLTTGEYPEDNNDPIRNANDRMQLYSEALSRGGKDQSVGECVAKAFAGLCGTVDLAFITGVTVMVAEALYRSVDLARSQAHQIRLN
jgi:hypothetical protein